ncbi:MAG TPA: hypothetical protein VK673_15500 [Chthoniobacterales bacterium]|jgi:hypothetical protein|nr:hypothetical protein [Chthoniobacterales bacterium]
MRTLTLTEEADGTQAAWRPGGRDLVFRVWVEDRCYGLPWAHLLLGTLEDRTVVLQFTMGRVIIRGPKAAEFYDEFCEDRATRVREDGRGIIEVKFEERTPRG